MPENSRSSPKYFVIADPNSHRWKKYSEAIEHSGKLGKALDWKLIPWSELLDCRGALHELISQDAAGLLRIESPGRDFEITRQLIWIGVETSSNPPFQFPELEEKLGWLVHPKLFHQGLRSILMNLHESMERMPHLRSLRKAAHLASMFDKSETCRKLESAGISTPEILDESELEACEDASALVSLLRDKWPMAYIKLNTGSSGSGIVVLNCRTGTCMTTMKEIDGEFFNTLRIQSLDAVATNRAINYLLSEDVCVQKAIPLGTIDGEYFDVRVIVINSKVEFTVFRLSRNPITNLHLGGRRGNWQSCRDAIPNRLWLDAMSECVETASMYDVQAMGIDLVFDRRFMNHYILEINGFGDFVPGWTNPQGQTIHQRQIELTYQQFSSGF